MRGFFSGRRLLIGTAIAILCSVACDNVRDTERFLRRTVVRINRSTPERVDAHTVLDSVTYIAPNTLRYCYTLSLGELTPRECSDLKAALREVLPDRIRGEAGLTELRNKGTAFEYSYNDPAGKPLFEVRIEANEYAEQHIQ